MADIPNVNPYGKSLKTNLRPADFNKMVWDQGIRILHEKTALCPCTYNKESGHSNINCTLCENGRIHFDGQEVWVTFMQKHMDELFQVQGLWELGDVMVTFPGLYPDNKTIVRVDYFDRITLMDFSERTTDLVKKPSSNTDKIRYYVTDVLFLRTVSKQYYINTDFVVDQGDIRWVSSNKPATNEMYSICYLYRPVYRVVNFFHEARYSYDNWKSTSRTPVYLPVQAQARRDYIIDTKKNYN